MRTAEYYVEHVQQLPFGHLNLQGRCHILLPFIAFLATLKASVRAKMGFFPCLRFQSRYCTVLHTVHHSQCDGMEVFGNLIQIPIQP